MNICLISEEFPPDTGWGGIAAYTYTLAKGLADSGQDVEVVSATAYGKTEESYALGSIRISRVKFKIYNRLFNYIYFRILRKYINKCLPITLNNLEFSYAVYCKIREIKKNKKIDIIESPEYDLGAFFAVMLAGIPTVIKLHTPLKFSYILNGLRPNMDIYIQNFLCRFMVSRARLVTSPSCAMLEKIKTIWRMNTEKFRVIPNPIDDNIFKPDNYSSDSDYILYVGRLEKRKGVHILLEAFLKLSKIYPDIKLIMIGLDTPTFQKGNRKIFFCEYMVNEGIRDAVKKNILFLGKIDRDMLVGYYQRALFGVFPSEKFDNFPYVCLEPMSCGLPMVYTRSGGASEIMEEGRTGFGVDAGDSKSMYYAMLKMAGNRDLLNKMSYNARLRARSRYGLRLCSEQAMNIYKDIIKDD